MKRNFLVAAILFGLPSVSFASVQINEIAWMGTAASANDEWIELYNPDEASVDLTQWTLSWALTGSSPRVVALSGNIAAKGYYLLERTSDATVPAIPADLTYIGALSNSGEKLILKSASGTEVDRVDGSEGWQIGSNTMVGNNGSKETAQRTSTGWLTAPGTPRAVNASVNEAATTKLITPPSADIGSATRSSANREGSEGDEDLAGVSAHDSSMALSHTRKIKPFLSVTPGRARIGTINSPLVFTALAYDGNAKPLRDARFVWSFGDGGRAEGNSVSHSYRFQGDYILILKAFHDGHEAVGRTEVAIVEPNIAITDAKAGLQGSFIELSNTSKTELNLAGWHLVSGSQSFVFPADTIIGAGRRLIFPFEMTKLAVAQGSIRLTYPDGEELRRSSFIMTAPEQPISKQVVVKATPEPKLAEATRAGVSTDTPAALIELDPRVQLDNIKNQIATLMLTLAARTPEKSSSTVRPDLALKLGVQAAPASLEQPKLSTPKKGVIIPEGFRDPPVSKVPRADNVKTSSQGPRGKIVTIPKSPTIFSQFNSFLNRFFVN